jgi:S1-C subfamily serine protease
MKATVIVVITVILAIYCLTPAVNRHPEDSVVLVITDNGFGSGVIVGPDTVLTAKHVAIDPGVAVQTASGVLYEVRDIDLDADDDLAVLYIRGKFPETPLVIDRKPFKRGECVRVIGTPYEPELMNCVFTGTVLKTDYDTTTDSCIYENLDALDVHVSGGCSGAPVLDGAGHVRGIVVLTVARIAASIPVGELDVRSGL